MCIRDRTQSCQRYTASSANKDNETPGKTGRLFVYTRYRMGARTDPCGTLVATGRTVEQDPSALTLKVESLRYDRNKHYGWWEWRIGKFKEKTFMPDFIKGLAHVQQNGGHSPLLLTCVITWTI